MYRHVQTDSFVVPLLLFLALSPILTHASASATATHSLKPYKRTTGHCTLPGDDNTYGLGIRIGLYLQWLTSSIAYNFVPDEAITMRGVNNCFQAAMFAGLVFMTVTKGPELYAVEAFLVLLFCMGGTCSGNLPPEVESTISSVSSTNQLPFAQTGASSLGGMIRFTLNLGFCSYGVWFVFKGMDGMQHPPCSTYAFFFARVNLFNWFRVLAKITFLLGMMMYASFVFFGIPYMFSPCWRFFAEKEYKKDPRRPDNAGDVERAGNGQPAAQTRPAKAKGVGPFWTFSKSNLGMSGMLVIFMLIIELMIKWNHIEGVNRLDSTGQLLPLIIGLGGISRVLHRLFMDVMRRFG